MSDPLADFCGGVEQDRWLYWGLVRESLHTGIWQEPKGGFTALERIELHIAEYHGESLDTPVAMG